MIQSTYLGLKTQKFQETNNRYIDEDNDIYPPPLMTKSPSYKVTGFNKLEFAMMYFRTNRLRELIINEENIFDKDYDGHNLISLISQPNYPTNIGYSNNKKLYDDQFFVVLKNLKPSALEKLFDDLCTEKMIYGPTQINQVIESLKDRPYMLLALWNYGLKYTEDDIKEFKYTPLKSKLIKYVGDKFVSGKRYHLLLDKCPITMGSINKIAILIDGTTYEYTAIKDHLEKSNKNPLTNEPLVVESSSRMTKDEKTGKWHGVPISCKVLYLPETDTFEHFDKV